MPSDADMTFAAVLFVLTVASQTPQPLRGVVSDAAALPLPGVLVTVKEDGRMAVTDAQGRFELSGIGNAQVIRCTLPGFETRDIRVPRDRSVPMRITLSVARLSEEVTVSAAAPVSAGQGLRSISPIDVVRTPGSQADLMRALAAEPGVSQVDDGAGLFVRGGDVSEVLVLIDGVVVSHPYRYETPTGGFRGAIDPFMTSGASFTTGGFSAAYGNSLSAIVDMQALGRPEARQLNLTAGLAGASLSVSQPLGTSAGVRVAANRTTPSLLFAVNPSPQVFDRLPGGWDVSATFAAQSRPLGSLRVIGLAQRDHVGVTLQKDAFDGILHSSTSHNLGLAHWTRALSPSWLAEVAAGDDRYTKTTDVGVIVIDEREEHRSGRASVSGRVALWDVHAGADLDVVGTLIGGRVPLRGGDLAGVSGSSIFDVAHDDWRAGLFAVGSRTIGRVTPEIGARIDRFDAASSWTADPRASVRIGLGHHNSVRLAAGLYHQAPGPLYFDDVRGAASLSPMSATHWVAGFEHGLPDAALFVRVEAYRKDYQRLPLQADPSGFSSDGYGHAAGLDVFVRRLSPRLDLKFSGSLLDAARRWTSADQQDRYPLPAGAWRPDFDIPYAAQVTATITLTRALSIGASWREAGGKPFTPAVGAVRDAGGFVPLWGPINSERLPRYARGDLSLDFLRTFGQSTAVFFASVDNVLDRRNVFDVAYSADYAERRPVTSAAPRAFYIGCSLTR